MATEKRLIDAYAVSECFRKEKVAILNNVRDPIKTEIAMVILHWCEDKVYDAPTVDAVEVVHGRWVKDGDFLVCLNCESEINIKNSLGVENHKNYCPNCGAKMDGGNEDV